MLLRALETARVAETDLVSGLTGLRLRLIGEVPAVRGRALQLQLDAQRDIARSLHAAYPEQFDLPTAGALVGAYIGAVTGALDALLNTEDATPADPSDLEAKLSRAVSAALHGTIGAASP